MKKLSQKVFALLLVLVMLLSLTACIQAPVAPQSGNNERPTASGGDLYYNETGYPICDETITIKVSGRQGNSLNWQNTYVVKYVEEKLGIKLICDPFPNDAEAAQYTNMLATETMPDLMLGCTLDKAQVNLDGADGYWLDLSQYLDIMPNLKKMMEENPAYASYITTPEGAIYSLSRIAPGEVANSRGHIYYQKSVLEEAYAGEIKTIDDFYNALKLVKAKYPDKTPLAITFDALPAYNADIILRTAFGINFNDNSYMLVADENGVVQLGDISEANRNYLTWLNKLVDEGLLSVEAMTMSSSAYRAAIKEGKFVFWSNTGSTGVSADDYSDYGVIAALTSQYVDETSFVLNTGVTTQAKIFVSAKTEYPEAICRLIDFFCSEEGKYMAIYGEEGVHFDLVPDQFDVDTIQNEKYADLNAYASAAEWMRASVAPDQIFAQYWNFTNEFLDDLDEETLQLIASTPSTEDNPNAYQWPAIVQMALNEVDNLIVAPSALIYTQEEANDRKTLYADLLSYLKAQKIAFVTGTADVTSNATWNAYVSTVKQMGWDKLQPIEQAAWDRVNG